MVLIFESEGAVRLNSPRKVRVSPRHQHDVTIQDTFGIEFARPVDPGVKAEVRAEELQCSSFREKLGGGAGDK